MFYVQGKFNFLSRAGGESWLRACCYMFVSDNRWIKEAVQCKGEGLKLEGKTLAKEFKPTWKQVENCSEKGREEKTRSTIHGRRKTRKTSAIMSMIEQIIKTRARKKVRGFTENSQCRLCKNNKRQCNVF